MTDSKKAGRNPLMQAKNICQELMHLAGVEEAAMLAQYDILRGSVHFAYKQGDKLALFSVNVEDIPANLRELDPVLQKVLDDIGASCGSVTAAPLGWEAWAEDQVMRSAQPGLAFVRFRPAVSLS